MSLIIAIISTIILFFLVFPFFLIILSRLSGEKKLPLKNRKTYDFGCIITAYKNVAATEYLVKSLLKQTHPHFHIYLVADACPKDSFPFKDQRLTVLYPTPSLNLKIKSVIHATRAYLRPHDFTVIFDADNLAHPEFLAVLNHYANQGNRIIQGRRTAKNLDTIYACADATGEFYKNYVERYVPWRLGSSAVISGSGMAIERDLYQAYLDSPEIQQGKELGKKMMQEDKILQNFLLNQQETIAYAWDAIIYDEKVSTGQQVETQRSRWLYSYFQNLPNSTGLFLQGLSGFNWNQCLFGIITMAPPLFILLFTAIGLMILNWWIQPAMSLALFAGLGVFAGTILWTLQLSGAPAEVWKALWSLPLFILRQFTALFKMANPNKNFKPTETTQTVQVEDLLSDHSEN